MKPNHWYKHRKLFSKFQHNLFHNVTLKKNLLGAHKFHPAGQLSQTNKTHIKIFKMMQKYTNECYTPWPTIIFGLFSDSLEWKNVLHVKVFNDACYLKYTLKHSNLFCLKSNLLLHNLYNIIAHTVFFLIGTKRFSSVFYSCSVVKLVQLVILIW